MSDRNAKREPGETKMAKAKRIRVYLVNYQTLGAMCGFGEGWTKEEATEKALAKARVFDPNAYVVAGVGVYFAGGVNC